MAWELIDTHAHLDDSRFDADRHAVISRAQEGGITHILTIGIDRATSKAAVRLAKAHPMLRAVVGIQPNHLAEAAQQDWDVIEQLAAESSVVGIGESGLDLYWKKAPLDLQEDYFVRHLDLARRCNLPIVIHCRDAEEDVVRVLQSDFIRQGQIRGVMHSFTGRLETAQKCLATGMHISFAGMITYKNAADLREVAGQVPLDRILVETDSPYLAPVPVRGQRNEPVHVVHTAECLAKLHNITLEEFARHSTQNARQLFRL